MLSTGQMANMSIGTRYCEDGLFFNLSGVSCEVWCTSEESNSSESCEDDEEDVSPFVSSI